ncbi:hypothetical protein SEEGA711_02813, partial [Salmonella enterica subsp. enterica serovar Gaminara str. ATCC BAA-711]
HQFLEDEKKGPLNYLTRELQNDLDIEWEASNATRY